MSLSKSVPFYAVAGIVLWLCGVPASGAPGDPAGAGVVINELHTNPDLKTELVEFVELHNAGAADVDLSGWSLTEGVFYTFAPGTTLAAGEYIIVVQSPDHIRVKWASGRVAIPSRLIFGPYGGALDADGERVVLCDAEGTVVDEVEYQLGFPWPTVGDAVPETTPGSGHSLQLVNPQFDNNLGGSWRSAAPTPAAVNRGVLRENLPPYVRQVTHAPRQPRSDQVVTVTAKVTDPDGVTHVSLLYQIVLPGTYVARYDAAYFMNWTTVEMRDDGLGADAAAHDDVYTGQIPAGAQKHRNLVRYQLLVEDTLGNIIKAPYPDDPQPNFAYFVYDGVPAWRGAVQPGVTPIVEFSSEVMSRLPVYHLISRKSDVEAAIWFEQYGRGQAGRKDFKWWGTLVYDGEVYDHIRYRMRGGVWRHAMGKNMFKFDFNRGHYFQARDDYGNKYGTKWDKLNFSACIQQGSFGQRGEHGLFEAVSFRMFNLAGCPASKTSYVHFRIVDERFEDGLLNAAHPPLTNRGTQYDGDFWGVYLTIEQMDGQFLDEHDLPDGNLYKMDSNADELNNQGPTQPSDGSDLARFVGSYRSAAEPWWRQHVNLDSYYNYYAIYQAVHHGDITEKNWFLYHHPQTDQWWQLPWDLDLTWTTYYGANDPSDPFRRAGVLNHSSIGIENKNRLREVLDLLFNPEQMNRLIDEHAGIINDPAGGLSIVDADRAMWDYHWVMSYAAYPKYLSHSSGNNKAGQGRFYQEAASEGYGRSFEGMVQVMKDYVVERIEYLNGKALDSAAPIQPTIESTAPAGFPINALTFRTGSFQDPQGSHTFAALQWRIAEVTTASQAVAEPPAEPDLSLISGGGMWKYFKGRGEPSFFEGAWRQLFFSDYEWQMGQTPIGFGATTVRTALNDMQGSYSTVYLRKTFTASDFDAYDKLVLEIQYDDGVNVWLNEKPAYQANVSGANLPYTATATAANNSTAFVLYDLGSPRTWLKDGTNVIAIQLLNVSRNDPDCFIDARLRCTNSRGGAGGPPPLDDGKGPGKYEIEAVWQSDEIKPFNSRITIPATAVRPWRTYRVRCRMKDNTGRWSRWSQPVEFVAGEPVVAGTLADLRVTEVMYNPPAPPPGDDTDNDEFEFIELKNTGSGTLDLTGVSFDKGITFAFQGSSITSLGPGKFALVVKNRSVFLSRYGPALSGLIAGEYAGKLANDGESLALVDLWNGTIAEFEYRDGRGWPLPADGGGHSLVPLEAAVPDEPYGSLNCPDNWRASAFRGGSPGQDDPAPAPVVVINEFLANTDVNDPGPGGRVSDWVELYNPTGSIVSLAGWYLSDDVTDLRQWALPAVSIPAYGRLVLNQLEGFGLSRSGEELLLSYLPGTAADRVVDCVRFKAQERNIALGRYPDGDAYWFRLQPSPGAANANPILDLLIDELMYHPSGTGEEYVELYNPLPQEVDLGRGVPWRVDGAVSYAFGPEASIPAGGRLVIVGFDPGTDTSRLAAFAGAYNAGPLTPGVKIVGPWTGSLSNGGERVALEKAQSGAEPADHVSWVIVDELIYSDVAPWPREPDGQGSSLQRVHADADHSGNDPANWRAATPSPGVPPR